jgi:transposase InsO family protein
VLREDIDRVWRATRRVRGARKVRRSGDSSGARGSPWRAAPSSGSCGPTACGPTACGASCAVAACGRRGRSPLPDRQVDRPRDLVERACRAERPNQLWVADFTYVATWRGMVYVAFIIDVFSRRIVGGRASASMRTDPALDALEQAVYDRETDTGLVPHSDRGSRYLLIRYTERLAAASIEASVGSRGNAYDNALAESVIGLFKTEVIRHAGPWRCLDDVEYAPLEWVAWFNTCRLLEPLGYLPQAEYERQFAQLIAAPRLLEHSTT